MKKNSSYAFDVDTHLVIAPRKRRCGNGKGKEELGEKACAMGEGQ